MPWLDTGDLASAGLRGSCLTVVVLVYVAARGRTWNPRAESKIEERVKNEMVHLYLKM